MISTFFFFYSRFREAAVTVAKRPLGKHYRRKKGNSHFNFIYLTMKKLLKSIALGLMLFLAVQVQAENNPKNGNLPNVEPVTNYVSAEPQDVQQVPCSIFVEVCGKYYQLPIVVIGSGCNELTVAIQTFLDNNVSC